MGVATTKIYMFVWNESDLVSLPVWLCIDTKCKKHTTACITDQHIIPSICLVYLYYIHKKFIGCRIVKCSEDTTWLPKQSFLSENCYKHIAKIFAAVELVELQLSTQYCTKEVSVVVLYTVVCMLVMRCSLYLLLFGVTNIWIYLFNNF